MERTIPIESLVIRTRVRKTLPKIESLAASIKEVGLLHPPAVHEDGDQLVLIAGQRRLEACRSLGWTEIPVTVCDGIWDELKALKAEGQENTEREPLNPAEIQMLACRLLPLAREAAKERQREAGERHGRGIASDLSSEAIDPPGEATEEVAAAIGVSRHTVERIDLVYEVAADPAQPDEAREIAQAAVKAWEDNADDAPAVATTADRVKAAGGFRPGRPVSKNDKQEKKKKEKLAQAQEKKKEKLAQAQKDWGLRIAEAINICDKYTNDVPVDTFLSAISSSRKKRLHEEVFPRLIAWFETAERELSKEEDEN